MALGLETNCKSSRSFAKSRNCVRRMTDRNGKYNRSSPLTGGFRDVNKWSWSFRPVDGLINYQFEVRVVSELSTLRRHPLTLWVHECLGMRLDIERRDLDSSEERSGERDRRDPTPIKRVQDRASRFRSEPPCPWTRISRHEQAGLRNRAAPFHRFFRGLIAGVHLRLARTERSRLSVACL